MITIILQFFIIEKAMISLIIFLTNNLKEKMKYSAVLTHMQDMHLIFNVSIHY